MFNYINFRLHVCLSFFNSSSINKHHFDDFLWVQTSIEMYLMRGARGHPSLNIYRALKFMLKFVKSHYMASQSNKPKEIILCSLSPKLLFTFLIAFYISSHKIYKNSACNESIVK